MGFLRKQGHLRNGWFWHLMVMLSSIASTAIIVSLLVVYDGQPILDLKGVTLNAVVAVFSTISKAGLAYVVYECIGQAKWIWLSRQRRPLDELNKIDFASRGPLGSFKLLGSPPARSFMTFGTVIVLLMVAINPLIQLIIGNDVSVVYSDDAGVQISYAERYSKGSLVYNSSLGQANAFAELGMQSAILYGLAQSGDNVAQETKASCSSGNCTWDMFDSLAVCSSCKDVTELVETNKNEGLLLKDDLIRDGAAESKEFTEFSLPNGLLINDEDGESSIVYMTANGTAEPERSLTYKDLNTLIWAQSTLRVKDPKARFPDSGVEATECALYYCVKRYSAVMESGKIEEQAREISFQRTPESWQLVEEIRNTGFYLGDLNYALYSPNRTDLQLNQKYNLSQPAVLGISAAIQNTFLFEAELNDEGQLEGERFAHVILLRDQLLYSPTALQAVYDNANMTETFDSLARSMSNSIRANADSNLVRTGRLGTSTVFIRVRWAFLALPLALTVAAIAFLAMVMSYTENSGLAVWGTEVLPMLVTSVRQGEQIDGSVPLRELESEAKSQFVTIGLSRDTELRERPHAYKQPVQEYHEVNRFGY